MECDRRCSGPRSPSALSPHTAAADKDWGLGAGLGSSSSGKFRKHPGPIHKMVGEDCKYASRSVAPGRYKKESWVQGEDQGERQAEQKQGVDHHNRVVAEHTPAAGTMFPIEPGARLSIHVR